MDQKIIYELMWRIEKLEKKVNFTWHAYESSVFAVHRTFSSPPPPRHPLMQLILICLLILIFLSLIDSIWIVNGVYSSSSHVIVLRVVK